MRKLGVHFNQDGKAEVVLWAPPIKKVEIALADGAQLPLEKIEDGYWTLNTDKVKEGSLYKFLIDGGESWPDPASLSQPEGVHGFSEAVNLQTYHWNSSGWDNLP